MTQPAALAWAADVAGRSRLMTGAALLVLAGLVSLSACTDNEPEPPKDPPRVPRPKMEPGAESSDRGSDKARSSAPRQLQVNFQREDAAQRRTEAA